MSKQNMKITINTQIAEKIERGEIEVVSEEYLSSFVSGLSVFQPGTKSVDVNGTSYGYTDRLFGTLEEFPNGRVLVKYADEDLSEWPDLARAAKRNGIMIWISE